MATALTGVPGSSTAKKGGYTKKEVERFWVEAGGNHKLARIMAGIAGAESGFGSNPYGDKGLGAPGYTSWGLWQIHTPAHPQYDPAQLVGDPVYNARAAVEISGNSVAGLGNWTTYKNSKYKDYLLATGASDPTKGNERPGPLDPAIATAKEGVADAAKVVKTTAELAAVVGEWLVDPLRVAKLVGGGVLLYMGLRTLTRTGGTSSVVGEARHQGRSVAAVAKVVPAARVARKFKRPTGGS